jgi:sulfatase maturation enzyme AslB (radical SAM superfamily)
MIPSPNILLTNVCNQNCIYCFAKKEKNKSKEEEMSLKNYKKLIVILKKNGIKDLRLMGGEPTLHSNFKSIMELADKYFSNILIFSNGLIPFKNIKILHKYLKKLSFNFNIDTPIFHNKETRKNIIKQISYFTVQTRVNIGFTLSDLNFNYYALINNFGTDFTEKMGIRFGIAKVSPGQKPFFTKSDFSKIGKKIVQLVEYFQLKKFKNIYLDCGLDPAMFSKEELSLIIKKAKIKGWGCQGKWGSIDIATNLEAFFCFPCSRKIRVKLNENSNLERIFRLLQHNETCFN